MSTRWRILATIAVLAVGLTASLAWAGAFEQGVAYYNKGQYKTAANYFKNALEEDSTNVEAMRRLGDCYFNLYSPDNPEYAQIAAEAYTKVLKVDPNDGVTRLHLAQLYAWTDDSEHAIEQFKELLKKEPENTTAMLELAEVYSWKPETYNDALAQCRHALKIDPKNKRAQLVAARVLTWKGEYAKALTHYEAYLENDPENNKVRLEYANTLSMAGRYDDAVMQFNYLSKRRDLRDQSLLGLAQAYYHAKRYTDAAAVVDVILRRDPNNAFAWRLRGLIFAEQRRINEAVEAFKKAIEINPKDEEAKLFLARAYAMNEATYPEAVAAYREVLKSQPDNVEVRTELARIYSYANNHMMAIEQYQELLKQHPDNVKVRTELVRALLKAERYEEAVVESEKLLKVVPDDIDARLLMAEVLVDAGRYEEAIDMYDGILEDKPNYLLAMVGLGWAHHKFSLAQVKHGEKLQAQIETQMLGVVDRIRWLFTRMSEVLHFNKAITILNKAAKKHPDATEPHLRLAEVYSQHKAYKSSVENYEAALKRDPRSVDAYLGMSWVYSQMGDHQKSVDAIRRAAQIDPSNIEVLGGLGDAYAYQQDIVQAIEALEKAVVIKFADLELHRRLANLYAQNRKYYPKAIRECTFILEQDPSDDDTRLLLARVLSWNEQYDESLEVYDQLLAKRPDDQSLYLEMMKVKVYSSSSDEVVAELREVINQDPNDDNARLALAQAYQVHNDFDLAEKEYRTVLKNDPKNSHAHLGLATIYREQEEFDRAVIEYREVLSTNPDSAEAYYGLGVIDRRNGRYERAVSMQKKVLELDPSNVNAFAELSYNHYLLSRHYIATTGYYHRAWWLLANNWGDIYGVWGEYPANIEQMRAILLEDPGNCDLRYLLAQELQNHNRNKEAVREYRLLLKYCPNHIGARIALADIFSYSPATYSWAIRETLEILKREPDNYEAHLRLARLYAWSQQNNASVSQYAWCIHKRPDELGVRMELAQVLAYAKRYNEAIRQYEIVLAQNPNRDDARMELARLFSYNNRIEDAIRQYEVVLKRDPNNFEASFALANLYSWDRRYYHRAIDLYRKLFLKYPKNLEARMDYGRLLYERGEFSQAEKAYRDAIVLEPDNVDAHLMLGRIYVGQRKREEAVQEFNKVLELKSDSVDAHYYLAQIYVSDPNTWDQALEHALAVLKFEPKNEDIRLMVARIYAFQENYVEAANHYKILVDAHPDDNEMRLAYALNLSYAEQYSAAAEQLKMLAGKKPNDAQIRLELGLAYYQLAMFTDAIVNLQFVVENDPWNGRAHRGLARSFKSAGDIDKAIIEYKRILIINPNDQEAVEFLKQYDIEYTQSSLLDEWFTWPGKVTTVAGGSEVPQPGPGDIDEAEQRYRIRLAQELMAHNRYKRARYIYEELVRQYPNNPYYHLALANIYSLSSMWSSAENEYRVVLELDPENEEAIIGLEKVHYQKAPRLDVFAGINDSRRFNDRITTVHGGSRFTYRFGDGSEVFGELVAARHMQDGHDAINRLSPRVGIKLGILGELTASGSYTYNAMDEVDDTHNWSAALTYNIYDYVGLEAYYFREDVRQTLLAMEESIGQDSLGGIMHVWPIDRLTVRGEYRYSWVDESDIVPENESQMINAGANYTFFNNPYFIVGYSYTHLTFMEEEPSIVGVYWSPSLYQQHAVPLELYHDVTPDVFYEVGLVPSYNIVENEDDNFGLYAFGGVAWQVELKHRLGLDAGYGTGLEGTEYWEYFVLLKYTYIFGKHSGRWR